MAGNYGIIVRSRLALAAVFAAEHVITRLRNLFAEMKWRVNLPAIQRFLIHRLSPLRIFTLTVDSVLALLFDIELRMVLWREMSNKMSLLINVLVILFD